MKNLSGFGLFIIFAFLLIPDNASAQRKMEKLGRGVVATHATAIETFISWRLLATEPETIGFNVYRSTSGAAGVKLNASVLVAGTNYTDATANYQLTNTYFVKPVLNGVELAASASFTIPPNTPVQPYYNVPIHNTPGYAAKFIWVGDLDGDGEYDFVFDKQPTDATKNILLEAYKRDGTFLWQLDCGPNSVNKYNISPGSSTLDIGHGDNFTVYDINNDGKSEVIVRTAAGVIFPDGSVLTEANNSKQFISVLNGMTGKELSRVLVNNRFLSVGPMNGHMSVAYLDGVNPSIVWGAKNRNTDSSFNDLTTAWSWVNGALVQTWQFNSAGRDCPEGHATRVADLDGDGKDEVTPMGFAIDEDGSLLWSLGEKGYVHGDRFSVGDLDPTRPGLEGYAIQQTNPYGMAWVYYDAKTGDFINGQTIFPAKDMARGCALDLDPRYLGYEFHSFTDALYNVSGAKTSTGMPSSYPNLRFFWDGDLGSEMLDNKKIVKWNWLGNYEDRVYTISNGINVGPNTPGFYGDIMGDWREEAVYEANDHNSLVVYTTPKPTTYRIYCLAQNPEYRNSMCVKGYYQSNMLDYYLGFDMMQPPIPPIQKANKYWKGTSLVWDNAAANWSDGSFDAVFANGDTIMFDISGNNSDTIRLNNTLSPGRIWAMNPDGKNYTIAGAGKLTGSMDLIKAQLGRFTLCGNYDYTGQTRISEGPLVVMGSLESKVLVQAKGNLGGIATFNGGVILDKGESIEGGRLTPGNGTLANQLGTMSIVGNLAVPGNNNFAFDIIPGSDKTNDSIVVNGNLTFSGVNKLVLNFVKPPVAGIYTLIKCTGTLTVVPSNFVVEGLTGVPKNLLIEDNQIKIQILSVRDSKNTVWKGSVDNVWNYDNANFEANSVSTAFVPNDSLLFDETSVQKTVNLTEVALVSKITFDAASNYTIGGTGSIGGPGDLVKNNSNNLNIQLSKNTYTGKTIVNGGTLTIATIGSAGKPSSLGSAAAASENITLNGVSLVINNNSVTDRGLSLSGNNTLTVAVSSNYAVFGGVVAGTGTLIKDGPGQLAFIGRNTYSGGTILRNGLITLGSSEANESGLGTGPITIENGTLTLTDVQANNQLNWNVIIPAGKTAVINTDGRCAQKGTLTGGGTLTINIPFIRTDFQGNWSAFTGKINVSGDFRIDNNYGYGNAAINMVSGVAYAKTGGTAIAFGELSGVAAVTLSGAAWTIGAKNSNATFNGIITGNSVVKVGTGAWTLTGASTYTGTTTVNGGKLVVNNATGSGTGTGSVTVNNAASLSGAGIISGPVTINNGGVLDPVNLLTISNTLTLQAGSKFAVDANPTNGICDNVKVGANKLILNGVLQVTKNGLLLFNAGNSFKILTGTNVEGAFSSIIPAVPGEGLLWDTSELLSTGNLKVVDDPTALKDLKNSNVTVYPNPATDVFTVSLPSTRTDVTIELYSSAGVLLESFHAPGNTVTVNLKQYAPGNYMVKVRDTKSVFVKQVIKL